MLVGFGSASAQSKFPSKPVELVVPFKPGGGTDRSARIFAPFLSKELGVPVKIINVAGGGGWVAWAQMAKWDASKDDHKIGYVNIPHVLSMHELWVNDEAAYSGRFVNFDPVFMWPKPVQQPRIPTLIGGSAGPKMFAHVAEWADGWMPIGGRGIREALPALRAAWSDAAREGDPQVIPFGTVPSADKLEYYESLGCTEVVVRLPASGRDDVLAALDSFTRYLA